MALIFCDGFDHYSTNEIPFKYSAEQGTPGIAGSGRFGNKLQSSNFNSGNNAVRKESLGNHATWILGCAFYMESQHTATAPIMGVRDGTSQQFDVRITVGRTLVVTRDGTVVATGTTILLLNVWYYIELKVTIGNTGSYELRVQGVTELSSGSADTQATANAFGNGVYLGKISGNPSATHDYDDFYVCNGSGSVNNDFLGDVRIEARSPNGNGAASQLDGSDGNSVDNYLLVDETSPNSDTDYVQSDVADEKDTYTFSDLVSTTGTVYGVQINTWAKKTDAGARSFKGISRLSATEEDSAAKALTTTYTYFQDVRETKPGGGAWTITDVNSAEFGVKVV